ncbi:hypothetical protein [Alkalilacustris brevis]|uniref:hypothetical protein n=1 Tax=Alkalilacustris brevis TaxID=2026338 RepID=UPI000E0DE144|nr:hypothetical protein [Alkalilacustris brevis]
MQHDDLESFLQRRTGHLARGPVALFFVEDSIEVESSLRHLLARGFATVLAFVPEGLDLAIPDGAADRVVVLRHQVRAAGAVTGAVNRVIEAAPGQWLHYGFNAEYLFHPFCESRSVGEMLAFHAEERREAMLTFVVDLYPGDLAAAPSGVSLEGAHLDAMGYFAEARRDPATGHPRERQLDFHGGIRWRFEQHIPAASRRIDRVALFRARPGLRLLEDHRLNDEEMNTYACPWHHNLSAATASFRTAKALRANPGSADEVTRFHWSGSVPFDWTSRQLMELGLMEPGQWF